MDELEKAKQEITDLLREIHSQGIHLYIGVDEDDGAIRPHLFGKDDKDHWRELDLPAELFYVEW